LKATIKNQKAKKFIFFEGQIAMARQDNKPWKRLKKWKLGSAGMGRIAEEVKAVSPFDRHCFSCHTF
jgi:hypothetical protein